MEHEEAYGVHVIGLKARGCTDALASSLMTLTGAAGCPGRRK
jgi:hypothetical protein